MPTKSAPSPEAAPLTSALASSPPAPVPAPVGFISPPPKGTVMPPVPDDYVPATPGEFASVVPRQVELSALPQAIIDLTNFADYAATLGATAPALAEVTQALRVGAQWSTVRQASMRFDGYASLQEGLAWRAIRPQVASLVLAFALAAKRNPKLLVTYAGLAKFLGAKSAIALKGGATRRANTKAKADGKPEVHGKVGKRRQRAAEKAALLAATGGPATATTAPAAAQAAPAPAATPLAPAAGGETSGGARS
jgi:hypothetical protein